MMATPARRAALLVAATLTAATLVGCSTGSDRSMPGMDHNATPMSRSATTAPTAADAAQAGDVMFAQMMIPHHQQAVTMADLALAKPSTSAQVRELATDIKAAQAGEIATMRGWLTAWGAPTGAPTGHSTGMDHGGGMMTEADMSGLEAADGAQFDRMWITMMITHHEGAVTMAEQVLSSTKDPEVKKLAEAVITGQKAEIATMRGLL